MDSILECRKVSKTFAGVRALKEIDFRAYTGEIHALVGENGAGKSTLMKIISGLYKCDEDIGDHPDRGIFLRGEKTVFNSPMDAIHKKVVIVHQELNTISHMKVYEYIFLNNEITKAGALLDRRAMKQKAQSLLDYYQVDIDADAYVHLLAVDQQKLVEVIKVLALEAEILILDEPTSVLTYEEAKHLFSLLNTIKASGVAVLFISHNLNEVINYCDRVTVIRDGVVQKELMAADTNLDEIVQLMIGRKLEIEPKSYNHALSSAREVFRIEHLQYRNRINDVSLSLKKGEILGISGLVGSGGTDIAHCVIGYGGKKFTGGMFRSGELFSSASPKEAMKAGIAYLSNDRKSEGLFLKFKLSENITYPGIDRYVDKLSLLNKKAINAVSESMMSKLDIRAAGIGVKTESLSGGNQQKVAIAKTIECEPEILLLDEPTIGIDVAAKNEVRRIVGQLATEGKSVILISTEYVDLKNLCDRVLIMFRGEIVAELTNEELTEEKLMAYSAGGTYVA